MVLEEATNMLSSKFRESVLMRVLDAWYHSAEVMGVYND